jgi:hypothetical protein
MVGWMKKILQPGPAEGGLSLPFQGDAVSEGLRGVMAFLRVEMSGFFIPAAAGDYLLTSGRSQSNVS